MTHGADNNLWASALVEECVRLGVRHVCVCPGARSAPLAIAFARHARIRLRVCHDERAGAFWALGMAKGASEVVAFVCTSGTAVANVLPALVEASQDEVPLLVLSADRPRELLRTGANQTIAQAGIFGEFVRARADLAADVSTVLGALRTLDGLVESARALRGPVHLNCQFREPLWDERAAPASAEVSAWLEGGRPLVQAALAQPGISEDEVRELAGVFGRPGVFLAGHLGDPIAAELLRELALRTGWPVVADVGSEARSWQGEAPVVLAGVDPLLAVGDIAACFHNRTVIHLGGRFVSKRLDALARGRTNPDWWWFAGDWCEPQSPGCHAAHVVRAPLRPLLERLIAGLAPRAAEPGILECAARHARQWMGNACGEGAVVRAALSALPPGASLFLGNSMPVRYADALIARLPPRVGLNRGASGIDGQIASAVGFAEGTAAPTLAVLGDVTALHDAGSLLLARSCEVPLVLLVLNNDGGGIFSHLPIAEQRDVFETVFGTPHGVSLAEVARGFGLSAWVAADPGETTALVAQGLAGGVRLVEFCSSRASNALKFLDYVDSLRAAWRAPQV